MAKEGIAVDEKIPSINHSWDIDETRSYMGTRVEEFLKSELRVKVGYQVIPTSKESDGYFHIWGFYSEEDYEKYIADREANADLLLFDNAIPISTEKGVTYSARLQCSVKSSNPIVAIEQKYEIGLRFNALLNDNGIIENAGIVGTLTFQHSVNGGQTWSTVGTDTIISRDTDDTAYDTYDIGKYFSATNPQQIRVRASYTVYDDEGNVVAQAQSAWVTFSNVV